jgi:Tol biopolymer transport system component
MPAVGGKAEAVTQVDDAAGDNAHTWPQLLPGATTIIFTALGPSGGSEDSRIVAQAVHSKQRRTLVEKAMFGRYLPTGHLVYATNAGVIYALPFDPVRAEPTGSAVPVLSDVGVGTWGGQAFWAASNTGTVIFLRPTGRPESVFRVVDSSGHDAESPFEPATMAKTGNGNGNLRIAPDGRRFALTGRRPGFLDIWLLDARTKDVERLTFDPAEDEFPAWSPDGRAVAYSSAQTGTTRRIFIKSIESGTQPKLVRTWPRHIHVTSWSRDGAWLAAYDFTSTSTDVWAVSADGKDAIAVANTPASETSPQFSPAGTWIAYSSNETGRPEIYVVSFPGLRSRRQVSTDGGTIPRWDPQGRVLYYLQSGYLVAHEVTSAAEFSKGRATRLFATTATDFDVAPDGHFVLTEPNREPPDSPLHMIVNWFTELKAEVPAR